jgi:hypothetical protein
MVLSFFFDSFLGALLKCVFKKVGFLIKDGLFEQPLKVFGIRIEAWAPCCTFAPQKRPSLRGT